MTRTWCQKMRAAGAFAVAASGCLLWAAWAGAQEPDRPRSREVPPPSEPVVVEAEVREEQEPRGDAPRRGGEPPQEVRERMGLIRELQGRIRALEAEIGQAREQGENPEEATRKLDELREQFRGMTQEMMRRGLRPFGGEAREGIRERLQARMRELEAAILRATDAGREDEAARLQQQAEELAQEMEQFERGPEILGGEGRFPPQRIDRMAHLRAAIESLHAAGLHEQANRLAEEARHLVPEGAEGGHEPALQPPRLGGDGPREIRGEIDGLVRGLREELMQMRREMDEMRRALRERAGGERRGEEPDRREEPRTERDRPAADRPDRERAERDAPDRTERDAPERDRPERDRSSGDQA